MFRENISHHQQCKTKSVMISLMILIGTSIGLLSHTSAKYQGQDYNSCGTRSVNIRGRVIGGLQSRPGMWPWQVAIYRGVEKKFHCGGALINSRWILSAAHCFHSATNEKFKYTITAGDFNISSKDPHEQERDALKIHLHPDYDFRSYENDIALVELGKGVKMGLHIRTICLPKANENVSVPGKVGSVAGWGWGRKRKPSPVLLHSSYRIQTNEQCEQATNYPFNQAVMFCAGDGKGGNDTCKGDSGGSLVRQLLRDGAYRWVTVGLVSWGEGCGRRHKYGYYTRMEPFVAWIQKKIDGSVLSCGNPDNIPHGTMIGMDFLVGFTVKYTCSEGYRLRGRSKIRCKRNGKWTRAPTCQKAECRDPGVPRYGVRRPRKSKYFYKDKVRFRCKTNYTIIGKSTMVCQFDGTWDRYKPVCLAPCKDPGVPEGGVRLDHNFRHGETVRFLCTENNKRQGLHLRICSNGRWDRTIPTCRTVECRDPGTPRNGVKRPDKNKYVFEDRIDFQCKTNYTLRGDRSITCQKDKSWSGSVPQCLAPCSDPGIPIRGRRLQHSFLHDEVVQFRCNDGWPIEGHHTIQCNNGRWDRDPPTCTVECRDPGTLIKGVRRPDKNKYVFEDRIDFQCDTNHTLRGDPFIICKKTKEWTGSVPRCLAPCRDPGIPIGSSRLQHSFLHNSVVQFKCSNPGWTMEGSHTIQCNNGRWDRDPPTCNKMCPKPNRYPANGGIYRSDQYVLHGSSIRFYCRGGYNLVGQEYVRCRNGTWNSRQPTCKPVECRDPGTPRNGVRRPDKNKYVFEDRIDFQCRTNYTLRGDRFITCQKDKNWSRSVPRCLAPCRNPGIPIGGSRLQHSFLHNSFVQFRCNQGWTREGSHTIQCNNGRWDRDPPTCNKMCARPNIYPVNGGIRDTSRSYRHNEYTTFYCRGGYQLVGQEYVRCRNGTWNSRQPTCQPVECRDPGTPRNGVRRPDKNKYVFEDRIDFQCRTNYTLSGDPFITCQKDKSWSRSVPQCLAPCRDPGTPNNGQRVGNSFLHGDKVRYSCRPGWNIEGSQTIRCYNGKWNQPTPECLECGSALGMKNRKIPDGRIRASSTRDHYHTAKEGRLNGPWAWCSGRQTQPYLEIDFGKPYRITALATQGSTYYRMWVGKYAVATNLAGSLFKPYKETGHDKVFIGNTDYGSVKKQNMKNPVIARRLRILPVKRGGFKHSSACMRVEIYGCDLPLDCIMTGSRVVAKWTRVHNAGHMYYKAYVTKGSRYWRANLETENHGSPRYKLFPQFAVFPFVLDLPPKHEELQVGTRVLAPWGYRYYTATINRTRDRDDRYKVRADDGDMGTFTIDQIRLLKAPRFCE